MNRIDTVPRPRPDAVDDTWLDRALHELVAGDAPPDLRARVQAASPARRAAAAAAVDAARPLRGARLLAAALVLLGLSMVVAVAALHREASLAPAAQEPAPEVAVRDAAQLAALLPGLSGLTLIARTDPAGARLPELPERVASLTDPALRARLGEALAAGPTGPAFALGEAQAELLLHLDGRRFVRARLRFSAGAVHFGTATFARTEALPAGLANALREAWQQRATAQVKPRKKLQVGTLRQLIAAIGSDRTIELTGGPIELSDRDDEGELPANPAVVFHADSGAPWVEIRGVQNLHLRALGDRVRLLGRSPDDVLRFTDCADVWLEGLILGHVQGLENSCFAPVLHNEQCRDFVLRDCELFGCGTLGIVGKAIRGLALEHCEVHTCRYGIVELEQCERLRFTSTVFRDCGIVQTGFVFRECQQVTFTDCSVTGMHAVDRVEDAILFDVRMDEAVRFERGTIRGNQCKRIANSKLLLVREGTDERDNGPDVQVGPVDQPGERGIEAGPPVRRGG